MSSIKDELKSPKDGLALILGAIFVLGLVFASYTYFSRGNETFNKADLSKEEQDSLNNISSSSTKRDDTNNANVAGASTSIESTESNAKWVATNYVTGDISGDKYTVKRGDTLWEIAEARYGDGTQWTKILEANKDSVGFLPNGRQALIVTGQELILP